MTKWVKAEPTEQSGKFKKSHRFTLIQTSKLGTDSTRPIAIKRYPKSKAIFAWVQLLPGDL